MKQSDWLKNVATYLFSKSSVKCIKLNDVGAKFILFSTSSHKVDIMRGKCVNLNFSICANVSNCRVQTRVQLGAQLVSLMFPIYIRHN